MSEKTSRIDPELDAERPSDLAVTNDRPRSFVRPAAAPPRPASMRPSLDSAARVDLSPSVPPAAPIPRVPSTGKSTPPPPPSARGVGPAVPRAELDRARRELDRARRELDQVRKELASLSRERDALERRLAAQQSRIRVLEADRERCEVLEMDSWDAVGRSGDARALEQRAARAEAESARLAELLATRETEIEKLRAQASAGAPAGDDLTQLKGVGRKFAEALRREGVTTFVQIAAWTDDDVAAIAKKIGTNAGRIRRDGWIERARELGG